MPGKAPTGPIVFLIAESLIIQPGGKVTIIGAFANGKMLVSPETKFPTAMQLAVYAVFADGEGKFKTRIRIRGEDNKFSTGDIPLDESNKVAGQPLQIVVNFNLFQFPAPGTYKVDILFDDRVYTNDLSVDVSDKAFT